MTARDGTFYLLVVVEGLLNSGIILMIVRGV